MTLGRYDNYRSAQTHPFVGDAWAMSRLSDSTIESIQSHQRNHEPYSNACSRMIVSIVHNKFYKCKASHIEDGDDIYNVSRICSLAWRGFGADTSYWIMVRWTISLRSTCSGLATKITKTTTTNWWPSKDTLTHPELQNSLTWVYINDHQEATMYRRNVLLRWRIWLMYDHSRETCSALPACLPQSSGIVFSSMSVSVS